MTKLTAKKLVVTAKKSPHSTEEIKFPVWEFSNGAILVPYENQYDYFFDSRQKIRCNGFNTVITGIEEEPVTQEWESDDLRKTIIISESKYSNNAGKIKELVCQNNINYQQDLQKICLELNNIQVDKNLNFTGWFFHLKIYFGFDNFEGTWHMIAEDPDREDFFENEYDVKGSMDECLKPLLDYKSKGGYPDIAK